MAFNKSRAKGGEHTHTHTHTQERQGIVGERVGIVVVVVVEEEYR